MTEGPPDVFQNHNTSHSPADTGIRQETQFKLIDRSLSEATPANFSSSAVPLSVIGSVTMWSNPHRKTTVVEMPLSTNTQKAREENFRISTASSAVSCQQKENEKREPPYLTTTTRTPAWGRKSIVSPCAWTLRTVTQFEVNPFRSFCRGPCLACRTFPSGCSLDVL